MFPLKDTVPSRSFPLVNWLLIGTNVFVFLTLAGDPFQAAPWVSLLALVPRRLLLHWNNPYEYLTLITSLFMHGGWAHLISNLLALYIFGDNVEDRMGSMPYLFFYLTCGVVASLVHVAFNATSAVPTVGASGAISGVLAAYLLLYPTARVITFIPLFFLPWLVEIPAVFYLGIWFVSQLSNGLLATVTGVQTLGGVAWWAHVGGFVAGLFLTPGLSLRRYAPRRYPDEYYPW